MGARRISDTKADNVWSSPVRFESCGVAVTTSGPRKQPKAVVRTPLTTRWVEAAAERHTLIYRPGTSVVV